MFCGKLEDEGLPYAIEETLREFVDFGREVREGRAPSER